MTPNHDIHPHVAAWKWKFEVYHPGLAACLPAVKQFCSAVLHGRTADQGRWLSLLGPSGVGKTYLLSQEMACLEDAASRRFWKIPRQSGFRGPQIAHIRPAEDLTDWKAPTDYAKYDLIYIEDIGSGSDMDRGAGAVVRSRTAELLQLRAQTWTMINANLYRSDIERQIHGRIASRLKRHNSWCVEIPADVPDYFG